MSIRMLVLACDAEDCAGLVGITEPTSVNDARDTASAAFGWSRAGDLDHCATCTRRTSPGHSSSSLMVFNHDETSTRENTTRTP